MESFDNLLSQYGRAELLRAEEADRKASNIRSKLADQARVSAGVQEIVANMRDTRHDSAPAEWDNRVLTNAPKKSKIEIAAQQLELEARVHRRRAEYAAQGFLAVSANEWQDTLWVRSPFIQTVLAAAQERGLVVSSLDALEPEPDDSDE